MLSTEADATDYSKVQIDIPDLRPKPMLTDTSISSKMVIDS